MANVFKKVIKVRCEVIVREEDVTKVSQILEHNGVDSDCYIGKYNWVPRTMWYIKFRANGKQMAAVRSEIRRTALSDVLVIEGSNVWTRVEKLI